MPHTSQFAYGVTTGEYTVRRGILINAIDATDESIAIKAARFFFNMRYKRANEKNIVKPSNGRVAGNTAIVERASGA